MKRYCEVQEIDGIETVTNIVIASDEVAKERGYKDIPGAEIGHQKKASKFERADKPPLKIPANPLQQLIAILLENKTITEAQAKQLTRGN
jgi:hypothetical protein